MTRALQIELGIQQTADNFGPTTIAKFNEQYPTGIHQQADNDESESNVYAIIQGALLCKGYATGVNTPTLHFYNGTGSAIKSLKSDAGCSDTSSTVTLNVMKALLSMDSFVSIDYLGGKESIRKLQQYLNKNYEEYIGLRACDGIYGRTTNTALIYAIQAEEKLPLNVANGNFGPTTTNCVPTIPYNNVAKDYYGNTYSSESISKFINLLKISLFCLNAGYEPNLNGEFDSITQQGLKIFQSEYGLSNTGICTSSDWLSLLVSSGDPNRSAIACDCATIITENNISVLKDNGYQYVGRYLSGTAAGGVSKALSTEELQLLFNNNIRVFPIHQGSANYVEYFTEQHAIEDAVLASNYAKSLELQFGTIIYFAVDCDVMDYQVTDYVIPYFKKLYEKFMSQCGGYYRVGIYGTRNTCTRVCDAGYACSSFVSDMSTGYSGNLGFPIPDNWAFDQFATVTIYNSTGTQSIEIDKDGYSGKNKGMIQEYSQQHSGYDTDLGGSILVNMGGTSIPVYEKKKFDDTPELPYAHWIVDGPQIGTIDPGEFYVRYKLSDVNKGDSIHRVLFKSYDDIKCGYIVEDKYDSTKDDTYIDYQSDFYEVNYDKDSEQLVTNSTGTYIFTVNKPVPYFNSTEYDGMLQVGEKIKCTRPVYYGNSRPWTFYVDERWNEQLQQWEAFDRFVSVGLELGNYKSSRALY
ncbi:TPA: DUF1906 domain-containing protein [Candidatus Ventrenecus avicola]|nr:DUF1906 domain-containing protein [Candidatus Ventrenecus avicola]